MDPMFRAEQERLDRVIAAIDGHIARLERETGELREEVVDIRRRFWEDVTVNTDTMDDLLETYWSMKQQAEVLSQRERSHQHAARQLAVLRRMKDSPYFGRIDFREDGTPAAESIYIGLSSLTDASGDRFLVYDWRAPVSSVYYDYAPGPAKYETPGGTVTGELEKKWQYIIRNGQLKALFDTGLTIGDELLQQVLGRRNDSRMRSIVATIQQEQNRVIRHEKARLVIVSGAAGSGKTSAALQRIAWLLYRYRGKLKSDQIILFSPNAMFNSYVAGVLPELGEENMQQATFQEYLEHRLGKTFRVEDPYEQLEYVLTGKDDPQYGVRLASIRFKTSQAFFAAMRRYRERLEREGMVFRSLLFRGRPIVSAREIAERFYGTDAHLPFNKRINRLTEWLLERLDESEKAERGEKWVDDEIELLSREDLQRVYAKLRKKRAFSGETFNDGQRERDELAKLVVRRAFRRLRDRVQALDYINVPGIYRRLFERPERLAELADGGLPERWEDVCAITLAALENKQLFYEDATPYLLLQEMIGGFRSNTSIRHVLVDEAQDYSPFQFEFLKRLFPAASMTVLGDFNQAIFAHAADAENFNPLEGLYGPDETAVFHFSRSYRSTRQIVEFTRSLVPGGDAIEPFERDGDVPVLTVARDRDDLHRRIAETVSAWKAEGFESIAVICKTMAESAAVFGELAGRIDGLKRITTGSFEYEKGVVVIPVALAKGIEFDAVIVYDASDRAYGDESLRRLLYTACTRAMHRLRLFSLGAPSRLLDGAAGLVREDVRDGEEVRDGAEVR